MSDKFKRAVRSRMEDTGETYMQARAGLLTARVKRDALGAIAALVVARTKGVRWHVDDMPLPTMTFSRGENVVARVFDGRVYGGVPQEGLRMETGYELIVNGCYVFPVEGGPFGESGALVECVVRVIGRTP